MTRIFRNLFGRGNLDCQDARELGSAYLENDLSARRYSKIQAHLNNCGPCRAFIDTLAATIGILARLPKVTPPPSFKQSITELTKEKGQSPKSDS